MTKAEGSARTMVTVKCFPVTTVKTKGSPRTLMKAKDNDEDQGLPEDTDEG